MPAEAASTNARAQTQPRLSAPVVTAPDTAFATFVPEPARPGFRLPRSAEAPSRATLYLGLLLAAVAGVARLLTRPGVVVHDSHEFRDALRAWSPYIVAVRRPTPRAAKKFLNRVRYYAMRQSAHAAPDTFLGSLKIFPFRTPWLARMLGRMGFAPPAAPAGQRDVLPERLLVALAAVQECTPDALHDDGTYRHFREFLERIRQVSPVAGERISGLGYPRHITPAQRDLFTGISAGIRVS